MAGDLFFEQFPELIGLMRLNPHDVPLNEHHRLHVVTWLRQLADDVEQGNTRGAVYTAMRPPTWNNSQPRRVRAGGV